MCWVGQVGMELGCFDGGQWIVTMCEKIQLGWLLHDGQFECLQKEHQLIDCCGLLLVDAGCVQWVNWERGIKKQFGGLWKIGKIIIFADSEQTKVGRYWQEVPILE